MSLVVLSFTPAVEVDSPVELEPVLPGGDNFNDAISISGFNGMATFSFSGKTTETGEPLPTGVTKTIWLKWTTDALIGRRVLFHAGDAAVYIRPDFASAALWSGEGDIAAYPDQLTTYYVQLGWRTGDPNVFTLTWESDDPPYYDAFETPQLLSGEFSRTSMTTAFATTQAGEPLPGGATATVWAQWTPSVTRNVSLTTGFGLTIRVFTGSTLGGLSLVASGTDTLTFVAASGTTYHIQIVDTTDVALGGASFGLVIDTVPAIIPIGADPPTHLRVTVSDKSGVLISELPRRSNVQFQEPLNIPGSGQVTIDKNDPIIDAYPNILDYGNIVKFWMGSTCVSGFLIKSRNLVFTSSSEQAGMMITVSGPTVHHLLNYFTVHHDVLPPRSNSQSKRAYTWAAQRDEWYDPADWDVEVLQWTRANPPTNAKKHQPQHWPVPRAKWIGFRAKWHYVRKEFNITKDAMTVRIYASSDEWFNVFIDGELVLAGYSVESGYKKFSKIDMVLAEGTHIIAVQWRGEGQPKADGWDNLILAICEIEGQKRLLPPIVVTNSTWVGHRGNPPPGWNRALVLKNLVTEAKERGSVSALALSFGFTGTVDSDGVPWTDLWNEQVDIGMPGLALQEMLAEGNLFDVWVDPETLTLEAWIRRGSNKSASMALMPGVNLLDYSVTGTEDVINDVTIRYGGGWAHAYNQESIDLYGAREGFVELGDIYDTQTAVDLINQTLHDVAWVNKKAGTADFNVRPQHQPQGSIIAVPGMVPFLDWGVGDTISALDETGDMQPHRVLSLSCTEDANGELSFDAELEQVTVIPSETGL